MNQPHSNATVEALSNYSEKDAVEIGKLLTHLSSRFDGSPVSEQTLQDIIKSPYHAQLVARDQQDKIIGAATLTITMGAGVVRKCWLEDFVVDPTAQGSGVGGKLWEAMINWCKQNKVQEMSFTSNPRREAAHGFYLKRGAEVYDTHFFKKSIQI